MPGRLLHARLRPPPRQRVLLLDGTEDDGQADAVQPEHAALPGRGETGYRKQLISR